MPNQKIKNKIKPCPYCGKDEGEDIRDEERNRVIRCMNCGALGPPCGHLLVAIEAWNERHSDDQKASLQIRLSQASYLFPGWMELRVLHPLSEKMAWIGYLKKGGLMHDIRKKMLCLVCGKSWIFYAFYIHDKSVCPKCRAGAKNIYKKED